MKAETLLALGAMGVTNKVLDHIKNAPTQVEGELRLEQAKCICKKGFHEQALLLHPDVTNGDPKKTARFKSLRTAYEGFQKARYKGWRKKTRAADMFDAMHPNDPMMANFLRLKREAQRKRQEQYTEEMLQAMFLEKLFEGQKKRPRRRGPRTRPHTGPKKGKVYPPHHGKKTPLHDRNGYWFREMGRWELKTKRPKKEA